MSIWKEDISIEMLNEFSKDTLVEYLDIKVIELGDDYIKASMPVSSKTVQPMRILHGGASVALAETVGSIASNIIAHLNGHKGAVGLSINANHVKSASENTLVYGIAKPITLGRSIHVWEIRIVNQDDELCCISRLTMKVLK